MVTVRSANEIIQNLRDYFRLAQPNLDTKPGTVARDLFIEAPASQLALLYDEIAGVSSQQSFRLVVGSDLDKLAKNYGLVRKQSTPATGTALLTFAAIVAPININAGDRVIANNGVSYSITSGISVVPANANFYRSVASKFRDQLDTAGISDEFAVQVSVISVSAGSTGNIGTYSLNKTSIPGVSNVTNTATFSGGTDQESDTSFRNRILAAFNGASVGTQLGYLNTAKSTTGVIDVYVVEPGDVLMTRDGTQVKINTDGSRTIISEGSGGKVDIIILGTNILENRDSFIYHDKSNNNDPTNSKNDIVLGQIVGDENKTINRKRIDNIKNGILPIQPVDSILEVTGSTSGSNFLPKTIDSLGRVSGNYELIKDMGVYGGSPWGFDTFHWIDNKISLFGEDLIKGQVNGQDAVTFTDVLNIPQVQQNISITNENSIVTSDRSIIQLLHTPATNVTRVFNVHTGERYIVVNQNFDGTGNTNTTGRIQISGNTLPSPSDQLQVDYSWIVNYDQYSDYDGLLNTDNPRSVTDSIDWGFASAVRDEDISFTRDTTNGFFVGTAKHPITTVISTKSFLEIDGVITRISSGVFVNRLAVILDNLSIATSTVDSVTFKNGNSELYITAQNNGTFTNTPKVVGINILYTTLVILPSDTTGTEGDRVTAIINSTNVFSNDTVSGSSNGTQITIPSSLVDTTANTITLKVTYIANVNDLLSVAVNTVPMSRVGNGFTFSNTGFNNFSIVDTYRREHQTVQQNTSNQFFIELFVPSVDFSLLSEQVISVIRLSDNLELWNSEHIGDVLVGNTGNYQLIFDGYHSPAVGDRVLAVFSTNDLRKFQPVSFENKLIKSRIDVLSIDPGTNRFFVNLNNIQTQSSDVIFSILEPNTDIIITSATDGYLTSTTSTGILGSNTVNFSVITDILNKKLEITGAANPSNNGIYDIIAYDTNTNSLTITNSLEKVSADQISIIRVSDGKELWNYSGTISGNKLLLPIGTIANSGDHVYTIIFNFKNLRTAPTKIIGVVTDQVINTGVINLSGTTIFKAENIVFTATNTGLKLNVNEALRKALNLPSTTSLPSNIKLARITKLEKVITASATNDEILSVLTAYDLKNTKVQNNLFYSKELLSDPTLLNLDFVLPSTTNNILNNSLANNLPTLGDKLRITFYYTVENDSENLSYTRNGTLYTNKKFILINKINVASGFKTSQSTRFTGTAFTQPGLGSRYKVFYDYTAPKQNERIVVRYNYNKLISDVTFSVENARPVNADVLVKQATQVLLDLIMNVVISDDMKSSTTTILQTLRDQLITAMTTNVLGGIVDTVTLINVAQSVKGIARARIVYFNKTGNQGTILKVQAQNNEYLSPNNITINTETR